MSQKLTVQGITEGAIMAGLTIILVLLGNIPFIGVFVLLFCSVPITITTVRQGTFAGGLTGILITILLILLFGPLTAISEGLQYILLGWVMGYMFYHHKSATKTIHASVITAAFTTIILLLINIGLMGFTPESILAYLDNYKIEMLEMYNTTGMTDILLQQGMTQNQVTDFLLQMIDMAIRFMPAMMIISHGIMAIITYFLTIKIFKRLKIRIPRIQNLQNWILPSYFIWGLIGIWALWLAGDYIQISWINVLIVNILIILASLLMLDGIALFIYLFKIHQMSIGMKIFLSISILFFFTGFLIAIVLAGLADLLFDFRKLRVDNKKE